VDKVVDKYVDNSLGTRSPGELYIGIGSGWSSHMVLECVWGFLTMLGILAAKLREI